MGRLIEIKFNVDLDDANQIKDFIKSLEGYLPKAENQSGETQVGAPKEDAPQKPAKKAKRSTAKTKVAEIAETPEVIKEEPKKESPVTTEVKIEDIRSAVAEKMGDHRSAIKDKLSELGAANVTTLDVNNYTEFLEFLNSL